MCVCVCVCLCVRACVSECVYAGLCAHVCACGRVRIALVILTRNYIVFFEVFLIGMDTAILQSLLYPKATGEL